MLVFILLGYRRGGVCLFDTRLMGCGLGGAFHPGGESDALRLRWDGVKYIW